MKLWRLPASGQALPSVPGLVLGPEPVQVEVLHFHPTADGVLASAAGMAVKVWDVAKHQALTGTGCTGHPSLGSPRLDGAPFLCVFHNVNFKTRVQVLRVRGMKGCKILA